MTGEVRGLWWGQRGLPLGRGAETRLFLARLGDRPRRLRSSLACVAAEAVAAASRQSEGPAFVGLSTF